MCRHSIRIMQNNMTYIGTVFVCNVQNNMTYTGTVFVCIVQNNMTYSGTVFIYIIQNNVIYTRTLFIYTTRNMTYLDNVYYIIQKNMRYTGTVFIFNIQNSMTYTGTVFFFVIQNNMAYTGTVFMLSKTTWHMSGHWLFVSPKNLTFCFLIMFFRNSILFARFCITPQQGLTGRCWIFTASCFFVRKCAVQANNDANWRENRNTDPIPCVCDLKKLGKIFVFGNSGKQK
jgi:uncharacterized protein (DUF2147 family)